MNVFSKRRGPWGDSRAEPLIGWRLWRVVERQGIQIVDGRWVWADKPTLILCSMNNTPWPFREKLVATAPPAMMNMSGDLIRGNQNGIYAFTTEQDLHNNMGLHNQLVAVGRVSLWGRYVRAENGYRAEFAYPYDIKVVNADERIAAILAENYAVDVSVAESPILETEKVDGVPFVTTGTWSTSSSSVSHQWWRKISSSETNLRRNSVEAVQRALYHKRKFF